MSYDWTPTAMRAAVPGSNGHSYHVGVQANTTTGQVTFNCDHPVVLGFGPTLVSRALGQPCCKHATALAEQLATEGHLRQAADGTWQVSPAALALVQARSQLAAIDPFKGLT